MNLSIYDGIRSFNGRDSNVRATSKWNWVMITMYAIAFSHIYVRSRGPQSAIHARGDTLRMWINHQQACGYLKKNKKPLNKTLLQLFCIYLDLVVLTSVRLVGFHHLLHFSHRTPHSDPLFSLRLLSSCSLFHVSSLASWFNSIVIFIYTVASVCVWMCVYAFYVDWKWDEENRGKKLY